MHIIFNVFAKPFEIQRRNMSVVIVTLTRISNIIYKWVHSFFIMLFREIVYDGLADGGRLKHAMQHTMHWMWRRKIFSLSWLVIYCNDIISDVPLKPPPKCKKGDKTKRRMRIHIYFIIRNEKINRVFD